VDKQSENHDQPIGTSNQLKEAILICREYFFELFRKWYIYVLFLAAFCALAFWYAGTKTTSYVANASLMTASESSSASGLMALAGQFGLPQKTQVSADKLVELLGTKRIIYTTLLKNVDFSESPVGVTKKSDLLVNHFLEFYKTDQKFKEETGQEKFRFTEKEMEDLNFNESLILEKIFNSIRRNFLNASATKNGIVHVNTECESESFAKYFTENIVEVLKNFYIDKTTEKQKTTYKILAGRTDSIKAVLENADQVLLGWYDANHKQLRASSLSAKKYLTKVEYERKAEIASAAYIEAIKQSELAKITLDSNTPIIQIVDFPTFPLKEMKPSFLIYLIAAIFAALLLATLLIVFLKLIRDALA